MDNTSYRLSESAALALSAGDADRLITLGSGSAALLYIYALRAGGSFSIDRAADALRLSPDEARRAAELLSTAGLFSSEEVASVEPRRTPIYPPANEPPEYTSEEMIRRSTEDDEFRLIVSETQHILGHTLSGADLKILFELYDELSLPTEVIFLLLNHCTEQAHAKGGASARVSMKTVEKEGYYWFNNEIITLERVEEYLQQLKLRQSDSAKVRNILQIVGRRPTASEQGYIDGWLQLGFSPEVIALAYDKTILKTGKLAWSYMDTILKSWHEKGLHTLEAIEAGDRPASRTRSAPRAGAAPSGRGDDSALLRELLSKGKPKN